MKDSGKNFLSKDIISFCEKSIEMGVGEILVNNIDNDGSFRLWYWSNKTCLENKLSYLSTGAGNWQHIYELFKNTDISLMCKNFILQKKV